MCVFVCLRGPLSIWLFVCAVLVCIALSCYYFGVLCSVLRCRGCLRVCFVCLFACVFVCVFGCVCLLACLSVCVVVRVFGGLCDWFVDDLCLFNGVLLCLVWLVLVDCLRAFDNLVVCSCVCVLFKCRSVYGFVYQSCFCLFGLSCCFDVCVIAGVPGGLPVCVLSCLHV